MKRAGSALSVAEEDFDISAEVPQNLAARSARRRDACGIRGNGHAPELACSGGDGGKDGGALSAAGEAVARRLDVAAAKRPAVLALQRRAYQESRVGRMCILARGESKFEKRIHPVTIVTRTEIRGRETADCFAWAGLQCFTIR